MEQLTTTRLKSLLDEPRNIRHVSVLGDAGCGKSRLIDNLQQQGRIISTSKTGEPARPDTDNDGQRNGIGPRIIPLWLHVADTELLKDISQGTEDNSHDFLISLIDSPGHADFSTEVAGALRITDGALLVVDYLERITTRTEIVIRQALSEQVKPALVINKVDDAISGGHLSQEELYQSFYETIRSVNALIIDYTDDAAVHLRPEQGNVAFGSGTQGWCFTLRQFATKYATKFGVNREKMMNRLWGDNYFNPKTKKWTRVRGYEDQMLERSFNQFILGPLFKIFEATMELEKEKMLAVVSKLEIQLSKEEEALQGKQLHEAVMHKLLPVADALLEVIVVHLPSPVFTQKHCPKAFYDGQPDEISIGMATCDPKCSLVAYISKILPDHRNKGRLYAFGRVFSGTIRSSQTIRIHGPHHAKEKGDEEPPSHIVQSLVLASRDDLVPIDEIPAGNLFGIKSIGQFRPGNCLLTDSEAVLSLKSMDSSEPATLIQCNVRAKEPSDLLKLDEGLKWLSHIDSSVNTSVTEAGQHVIGGTSESRLNISLSSLQSYLCIPLQMSSPFISYRESVTTKSSTTALSKTANKFIRFWMTAEPLDSGVTQEIENGTINLHDKKHSSRRLAQKHDWEPSDSRRIWTLGIRNSDPNVLVDHAQVDRAHYHAESKGDVKDAAMAGWRWALMEGPIAEEPMRSVRFDLADVNSSHSSPRTRKRGQLIDAFRRVLCASILLAQPVLLEPIYKIEIKFPAQNLDGIRDILHRRGARIETPKQVPHLELSSMRVTVTLPVASSFGLAAEIQSYNNGETILQTFLDTYLPIPGDPLDPTTKAGQIVREVRLRKGISAEIPALKKFLDKL